MSQVEMLTKIAELQFVCVDLNIYIDTHPCDEAAKADYLCYSKKLMQLMKEYEMTYEPLMNFGHSPTEAGCYVCSEWPWEV